ncbi:hypothetical protein D915_011205, partial [Fasciola hepatica]
IYHLFTYLFFFSHKCITLSHVTKVISIEDRIFRMHDWVREAYSWPRVAQRTELVYYAAVSRKRLDFKSLLDRYSTKIGGSYSIALRVLARIHRLLLHLAAWFRPTHVGFNLIPNEIVFSSHLSVRFSPATLSNITFIFVILAFRFYKFLPKSDVFQIVFCRRIIGCCANIFAFELFGPCRFRCSI